MRLLALVACAWVVFARAGTTIEPDRPIWPEEYEVSKGCGPTRR